MAPRPEQIESAGSDPLQTKAGKKTAQGGTQTPKANQEDDNHGRLWLKEGNLVRPLDVQIGLTDGSATEVSGAGVEEGLQVVTGEVPADEAVADTVNPFTPKFLRGNRNKPRSN